MKKTIKLITATAVMICLMFVFSADVDAQSSSNFQIQNNIHKVKIGTGSGTSQIIVNPEQVEKAGYYKIGEVQNQNGNSANSTATPIISGGEYQVEQKTMAKSGPVVSGGSSANSTATPIISGGEYQVEQKTMAKSGPVVSGNSNSPQQIQNQTTVRDNRNVMVIPNQQKADKKAFVTPTLITKPRQ